MLRIELLSKAQRVGVSSVDFCGQFGLHCIDVLGLERRQLLRNNLLHDGQQGSDVLPRSRAKLHGLAAGLLQKVPDVPIELVVRLESHATAEPRLVLEQDPPARRLPPLEVRFDEIAKVAGDLRGHLSEHPWFHVSPSSQPWLLSARSSVTSASAVM